MQLTLTLSGVHFLLLETRMEVLHGTSIAACIQGGQRALQQCVVETDVVPA